MVTAFVYLVFYLALLSFVYASNIRIGRGTRCVLVINIAKLAFNWGSLRPHFYLKFVMDLRHRRSAVGRHNYEYMGDNVHATT